MIQKKKSEHQTPTQFFLVSTKINCVLAMKNFNFHSPKFEIRTEKQKTNKIK